MKTLTPSLKWGWELVVLTSELYPDLNLTMNHEISKKCSIFGSSVQILGWMPPSFDGYSLQFTLDSWAPPFDEEWGMNVHSGATISFSCLGPQLYLQFVYKATLSFTLKIQIVSSRGWFRQYRCFSDLSDYIEFPLNSSNFATLPKFLELPRYETLCTFVQVDM
jgi:hypothetical protein